MAKHEHERLPADLRAIRDRLASIMDACHLPVATQILHPPHQRANEVCETDECIGYRPAE